MLTIIPHPDAVCGRPAVKAVQSSLLAAGFDPLGIDGIVGDNTRLAWVKWWSQRVRHLDPSNPHHLALRIALRCACGLVQRGHPRLDELLAKVGATASSAHCAYACHAWYHEAGEALGLRLTSRASGGVVRWWHRLTDAERIPADDVRSGKRELSPGMMFFRTRKPETAASALRGGTPYGHCGLVEREGDNGDPLWTCEGNTNGGDSATGGRVVAKATLDLWDPRLLGFAWPAFEKR